jgi:hypothetical protein
VLPATFDQQPIAEPSKAKNTDYAGNLPVELYLQTKSNESDSNGRSSAIWFLDLRPSMEFISFNLSQSLGPGSGVRSFLGQASAGVELSQSIRVSFQYKYASKNIFSSNAASGSSTTATTSHNGFHLAVSFSPGKSKSGSQQIGNVRTRLTRSVRALPGADNRKSNGMHVNAPKVRNGVALEPSVIVFRSRPARAPVPHPPAENLRLTAAELKI